jgi:hydroxymethylpyrimidine pyrophosphatase-like HAD family hydrolase
MIAGLRLLAEDPEVPGILADAEVLYSDLDGTLLGQGGSLLADHQGKTTLVMARAVAEIDMAGLTVVMVSGRNAVQLTEISRLLGWRDFIAELGAVAVYDRGERVVYDTGVWPEGSVPHGLTPYNVIQRAGAVDELQRQFPGLIEYHAPWHRHRQVTHVLRGELDLVQAQAVLDTIDVPPIDIIDNGVIHPWQHTLVGVERIHAYHLIPRGVSKRGAIERDLKHRGVPRNHAIAAGDSRADLQMAEAVELMVLVANGLDAPVTVEAAVLHDNVFVTRGRQGHGWAELARAWLAAKGVDVDACEGSLP